MQIIISSSLFLVEDPILILFHIFQLVGLTSLLLAAKIEEQNPPEVGSTRDANYSIREPLFDP